jgi:hypothetical protein
MISSFNSKNTPDAEALNTLKMNTPNVSKISSTSGFIKCPAMPINLKSR